MGNKAYFIAIFIGLMMGLGTQFVSNILSDKTVEEMRESWQQEFRGQMDDLEKKTKELSDSLATRTSEAASREDIRKVLQVMELEHQVAYRQTNKAISQIMRYRDRNHFSPIWMAYLVAVIATAAIAKNSSRPASGGIDVGAELERLRTELREALARIDQRKPERPEPQEPRQS